MIPFHRMADSFRAAQPKSDTEDHEVNISKTNEERDCQRPHSLWTVYQGTQEVHFSKSSVKDVFLWRKKFAKYFFIWNIWVVHSA